MISGGFDFTICGSTPFAGLVAGLLATVHGKRVAIVAEPWSPYRLPRRFDLSVMAATRPETWALLKREVPETLKLINSIGRGLFERIDPLFVGETAASADRLGHMRWIAAGLGFAAERAVDRSIADGATICRIRDAAMLVGGKVEPAIDAWLAKASVERIPAATAVLAFRRDGTVTITSCTDVADAGTVVLCDDDAMLTRLTPAERHRLLVTAGTGVLTEPAKPLSAALIHYLDRQVTVHQRGMKGPVTALSAGDAETAAPRIGASLASLGRLKRAGQTIFRSIDTADGAPLIGRLGKGKATILAGLGPSAAFVAPAVARLLAGAATEEDTRYFEPRDVSKAANRQGVAETAHAALELAS